MSGVSVAGRKSTPRSYCAHLYCTRKRMYEWRFYFVITQDFDAMYTVVRQYYANFATLEATLKVGFEGSEISLEIPVDGIVTREGWTISPFTSPTISRKDVDGFKIGQWIPQCELIVQWERKDQKPVPLRRRVNLIGTRRPYNFIYLTMDPSMEGETSLTVESGVAGHKRKQSEGSYQGGLKKMHLIEEQLSIKEKEEASLLDIEPKMEWSLKEELKDVEIAPSEKDAKPKQVEMFSGLRKGDLLEQLATKSQLVHDMISQLRKQVAEEEKQIDEQIAEKDELIVKCQQMYEELQKKLKSSGESPPPVSIKAYMRGTEVIAQQTFTLTQEAVDLKFEGYGFKLHVPEGSLPEEVSETQLNVRVSLSGQFQLPTNCELISAVYWVSSPHKFMKAITVEIQHCAALSSDEQSEQLTFIHTKCTQKELPYVFKEQVGGVFSRHSSDGSVSLSHFSGLGIVRRLLRVFGLQTNDSKLGQQPPPSQQQSSTHIKRAAGQEEEDTVVQYCAQLYTRKYVKEWRVDFVVTKNLESFTSVVEKEYSSHGRQQFSFIFGFKKDFISLKIPVKGLQLDGWKITPFYKPKITRKEVNSFKSTSGTRIPKCELVVEWVQDTPPVRLQHSISLIGAHDHHNFMLHINPDADISTPIPVEVGGTSSSNSATTTSHNVQRQPPTLPELIRFKTRSGSINILKQIGTHYRELGVLLLEDATGEVTRAIIEQHCEDATKINFQIFQKWIQGKGKLPVEWSTLVEVLKNIELVQLANEIEQNLK